MSNKGNHTILLGGIGGDSHSVGLNILRQALLMDGYQVRYLGTQNRLEHFSQLAALSNVVMMSSMDGHAPYYLREFPELGRRAESHRPLWYLGGNLHLGDDCGRESVFLDMGFDRVFVKFIDATKVLELLRRDLDEVEPMADCSVLWEKSQPVSAYLTGGNGSDALLELDEFERQRREVLAHWKTGYRAADLAANAAFLSRQPSLPNLQAACHAGQLPTLIQPRSGVSLLKEQIKLFKAFKSAGVPVLSYQVDSLTRNNNYAGAEEAIRHNSETGEMTINGFPVINHGVVGLRRVMREVGVPLQTRHSTRDPRLLAEISYAGGVTSFEGGSICYNIPYYKDYPLDESIRMWQYVDRLTGLYYEKFGVVLDREYFGTLTATLIPPCLAIAVCLMETLLSVAQGVKCVSLGYAEQGHRIQDIAAIRTLGRMAHDLLDNLGYGNVQVSTVFHQYMAAFPSDRQRAADIIYNSAITAAQSGATRIIIKTPSEAIRIPTLADNLHGIGLVQRGMAEAAESPASDETRIEEECGIIRREVEALLEHTIFSGGGDVARGIITGFQKGYLDIPFSPSIHNRGEVMTARDTEGAVRFLSLGKLPFNRELRQFHQEKMQERRRVEGLLSEKQSYLLVERDVLQMARGQYEEWPLFK